MIGFRKGSLRRRAGFWLALAALCAHAQSSPGPSAIVDPRVASTELKPHLYFDGQAFANKMTDWTLENTKAEERLKQPKLPSLRQRLHAGSGFREDGDPSRQALEKWVMSQPDNSITPDRFYAKAFEIEGGRVGDGLSLVWDVLREGWGFTDLRNDTARARKFVDITGELSLFRGNHLPNLQVGSDGKLITDVFGKLPEFESRKLGKVGVQSVIRGDNFSAWYHFAGTALNSFYRENSARWPFPGDWETRVLIMLEEHVLYNEFLDPFKRRLIDIEGGKFGVQLARNLRTYSSAEKFNKTSLAKNTEYLYENPKKIPESWALKPGQHPRDYGSERHTLFSASTTAEELHAKMQSHDPIERYYAVEFLNEFQGPKKFELTELALADDDPAIRRLARGLLLPQISSATQAAAKVRVTLLDKGSSTAQLREAFSLLRDGLRARVEAGQGARFEYRLLSSQGLVDAFESALKSNDPKLRAIAADALQYLDPKSGSVQLLVEIARKSPDPTVVALAHLSYGAAEEQEKDFMKELLFSDSLNARLRPYVDLERLRQHRIEIWNQLQGEYSEDMKRSLVERFRNDSDAAFANYMTRQLVAFDESFEGQCKRGWALFAAKVKTKYDKVIEKASEIKH
jgi:hypothetical protein